MKLIRVAAATLNQTPLDWHGNEERIRACIEGARAQGASILCLPELCVSGYGCEDAFLSHGTHEAALAALERLVPATAGMLVSLGLPLFFRNAIYNAVAVLFDGRILGFVGKQHLAGDGVHYEPRWFKPWPEGAVARLEVDGVSYPLGDLYFRVGGIGIGFEICEDAWVAQRPGGELAAKGIDVILNPSASHFACGKNAIRERLVVEGSRAFGVTYLYANLLGNEAGRIIYDGGALIASAGEVLARTPRFSFADHQLATAVVDLDATRMSQARTASFQPRVTDAEHGCVGAEHRFGELEPLPRASTSTGAGGAGASWETGGHLKEEELTRAMTLGLLDYMRKSRAEGFVVSLSGGCDSSVVATLVKLMCDLAFLELGRDGFAKKLRHVRALEGAKTAREAASRLLTCAYQATRNSSAVTRRAAREVAAALGAEFHELDVDHLVGEYTKMIAAAVGRPLTWETDDLALQNIQARVRGPGIWMIANLKRALLLSTSNRSEAAVGYATMDGDTCGGLCPIAGIDKAFLRRYLRWIEEHGPEGAGPIPALAVVTKQVPTAELRPVERAQTDEADLMPYDLLDVVERAAIRDKQTPLEVFRRVRAEFREIEPWQLQLWVARFFQLFSQNQWKRERYAPSFHLDDENLDPKTWCRFPILSSGFAEELVRLRAYVEANEEGLAEAVASRESRR